MKKEGKKKKKRKRDSSRQGEAAGGRGAAAPAPRPAPSPRPARPGPARPFLSPPPPRTAAGGSVRRGAAPGGTARSGTGTGSGRHGAGSMAEIGIDQSKLPGVKEVCRDFAVLEDHTLAHNLQEQEIEHHLATNIQRNRLVQHDLQVARQLQEEEDLKARAQIQKRQKDLERQDSEIAQEIQVKLVFEAEQRRRQEEKDEDIARLLQQKELQEEKKRKKHYPESQGHKMYEDSYYSENGGTKLRGMRQATYDKPLREQELSDAEIARKLQEEELLANQADQKAAQVAQDEEIARLLMAEEKKAFKKGKEREKSSFEKKRHDQDWKHDASESPRSRSKEGPETQRHKGDKSVRSQPLLDDFEHARYYTSQSSPLRQFSKPEHSPKGSRRKQ
uniref:Coiled-coil domain containing 50 n=1 Tax=Cairina moschata TaxID=8855 RepID=A0A8C3CJF1_CAIMO